MNRDALRAPARWHRVTPPAAGDARHDRTQRTLCAAFWDGDTHPWLSALAARKLGELERRAIAIAAVLLALLLTSGCGRAPEPTIAIDYATLCHLEARLEAGDVHLTRADCEPNEPIDVVCLTAPDDEIACSFASTTDEPLVWPAPATGEHRILNVTPGRMGQRLIAVIRDGALTDEGGAPWR